jgi:DNA-binding transcriptional LysR family regulator
MEMFELRYFLGVAKYENIHRASESLNVSPGSLSKAITRLEDELAIKLFLREGRNIKLSDYGRLLQRRALEIVQLEELAKMEVAGHIGEIQIVIAGPETLLSNMGLTLSQSIKKKYPFANFDFHATDDESALTQINRGEAHLAIITNDVPTQKKWTSKILAEATFQTYVGAGHPLYKAAKAKKIIPIEEILTYSFVGPSNPILGKVGLKQSLDGWRDDQFPRKVEYKTSSLKLLEELVVSGKALAYLPDYYCKKLEVETLKISGCPYSCVQKIKLVSRNLKDVGWLNHLF